MADAGRALDRMRFDADLKAEVLQGLREKVVVGCGAPPKLETYSARGPLAGWIRAIAVHDGLQVLRARGRRVPHDGPSALDHLGVAEEPELLHVRAAYEGPFKAAFAEVLATLAPRDRNVMRLVYVEGLTAEQVGLAYGVHRVSVARWLGQIRETLFARTRTLLEQRLQLSPTEFMSLTRACLSQIDVSLDRLLGELDPSRSGHSLQ